MNVNMGMIDRGLRLVVALVLLYLALGTTALGGGLLYWLARPARRGGVRGNRAGGQLPALQHARHPHLPPAALKALGGRRGVAGFRSGAPCRHAVI